MAQLQQQLRRLEAERDRLRDIIEAAEDRVPASKACENIVEFVNKNAKEDPLLPGCENNPWTSNKPTPGGGGKNDCCVVC